MAVLLSYAGEDLTSIRAAAEQTFESGGLACEAIFARADVEAVSAV